MHTDASLVANNSQRCWMLHVASVCTPCWMLLHVIAVSLGAVAQSLKPVRLRVLKQCGAPPVYLANVFVAIVRPVLQHAVSVWQNIPEFLASTIESIQKRAMRFIFPMHDYNEALSALSLTTLKERRVHLCQVYIARLQNENHPLHSLNWRKFTIIIIWGQKHPICKTASALKILLLLSIRCCYLVNF